MTTSPPRKPRVFATNDPNIEIASPDVEPSARFADAVPPPPLAPVRIPTGADVHRGLRWGAIFLSAAVSLFVLAVTLSFTAFVSDALARNDWIGWLATGLAAVASVSLGVIVLRELVGLFRLRRLSHLRTAVADALRTRDLKSERLAVKQVEALFSSRSELRWGIARLRDHDRDVRDPGDLLALAERELIMPIDNAARRLVLKSAKRVSVVTAISPMAWIAMIFVLVENLRLMRKLAGLYGGRPGMLGALRLARMTITHILATGGLAMTDDLLGQFLGQDLLRRLSRRLGEGLFNGALTARIGVAAIEVTRPLPFLEAAPIRARDMLPEIFRRTDATTEATEKS